MLEVIFYESTEDLINNDHAVSPLIICPSPTVADGLRRFLPENSEIITISKWVSDYLKRKGLKRSNKAELMLRLSSVWRHYFPHSESHLFFKAFELFTDLRSHSLELELLSEFMVELDEVSSKSLLIFWTFLNNEKLIDEHLSYQLMSEMKESTPLWFAGFKHLSGVQIDMLKTLSEKVPVNVFFPKDIYPFTQSTDWVRWILPEANVEIEPRSKKLATFIYPKNKLNLTLEGIKKDLYPNFDIALASKNTTFHLMQEVASEGLFFKSQVDLFVLKREELFSKLNEALSASMDIAVFLSKVEELKQESLRTQDFILYKILTLLIDAVTGYAEFQSTVDQFSLKVFKTIVELNAPRVFLTSLENGSVDRIFELSELVYREGPGPLFIIASSNYGPLKSGETKYSEKMIGALKSIAPIKRAGLDFLYLKSELMFTLFRDNTFLLLEEGLEKIDLAWREILAPFELQVRDVRTNFILKKIEDHLAPRMKSGPFDVKHFSASRLQSYLDCPRKYYFSYIDKLEIRPDERLKIAPDEMGTIEHEIIKDYFSDLSLRSELAFDNVKHNDICQKRLDLFLVDKKITLDEKTRLLSFYELQNFTRNGIEYLLNFSKEHSAIKMSFEVSVGQNPWGLVGSLDCLVELPEEKMALFDFKRSSSAIGSKKETLSYEKIQLWVYLLVLIHQGKKLQSWGYLNISEIASSLLFNESETSLLNGDLLEEFKDSLEKTIVSLKQEVNFSPRPRNSKACQFCEVELMCSKGRCS